MQLQISTIAWLMPTALSLVCAIILGTGIVHTASSDEEAVRKVVNGFPEAWNRHDMNGHGALFTSDADFVNVTATHWKGRESIQLNSAFLHGAISRRLGGCHPSQERLRHFQDKQLNFQVVGQFSVSRGHPLSTRLWLRRSRPAWREKNTNSPLSVCVCHCPDQVGT